jgi:hypothetical protein
MALKTLQDKGLVEFSGSVHNGTYKPIH